MLLSIVNQHTLRSLILRPTVGVIRQHYQDKFVTTLTHMRSNDTHSVLPALKEIQLISTEKPYLPAQLFSELQQLQFDMEFVQFQPQYNWPLLEALLLRGTVDLITLEAFLDRHKQLKHVQIAAVSTLRPLENSPGTLHQLLRRVLGTMLSIESVEMILDHATVHADGHERSLLQHSYALLDEVTDEETAKDLRRRIVGAFDTMVGYEFEMYCTDLQGMHIQPYTADQLEVVCSIEVLWEDELALKGMTSVDKSKDGLWINEEVKGALSISREPKSISLKARAST